MFTILVLQLNSYSIRLLTLLELLGFSLNSQQCTLYLDYSRVANKCVTEDGKPQSEIVLSSETLSLFATISKMLKGTNVKQNGVMSI